MQRELYTAGAEHALSSLRLKVAFPLAAIGRGISSGFGKLVNPVMQAAGRLEVTAPAAMGAKFGPTAATVTQRAIKGVPSEIVKQTGYGTALGATLGGIQGARNAEPGNRVSGALRGAATTGARWGLFGGVAGLGGQSIRNATTEGLRQLAKAKGAPNDWLVNPGMLAHMQQRQGFGSNLKSVFTGKGPLGRTGAGVAAAGSAGAMLGGEMILPSMLDKAVTNNTPIPEPQYPAMQRTASAPHEDTYTPPPMPVANLLSTAGGVTAGIGTGLLFNKLEHGNLMPHGGTGLARQILSPLASTAAGLTAYHLGKKHFPDPEEDKLKRLDMDKLLQHYSR